MPAPVRISLREAAEGLGVHYMTAYRYVRTGRLPAEQIGALWMVDVADLGQMASSDAPRSRRRLAGAERPTRLVDRLVVGDEAGAWAVIEGAMASGMDPADVYSNLLAPALRAIGEGWASRELTIADEHRATSVSLRIVGRLGPRFARRGRTRGAVVLGAPPGDQHCLPGAMLADLLRAAGFAAVDLGANTPAESFADASRSADPLIAVLVGATAPDPDTPVRRVVRALHGSGIVSPVLVGGRAIADADHARRLGADGWTGHDAASAIRAVEDAAHARSGGVRERRVGDDEEHRLRA